MATVVTAAGAGGENDGEDMSMAEVAYADATAAGMASLAQSFVLGSDMPARQVVSSNKLL